MDFAKPINLSINYWLARGSFYAWVGFLCLLLAVGFFTILHHGGDTMAGLLTGPIKSPGFFTAMIYSLRVAVITFALAFGLAGLLTMTMPTNKWAMIICRGFCFFWLGVPPLTLLVGMDGFYNMAQHLWPANVPFLSLLNPFPNPNGAHQVIALVQKETPFLLLVMLNAYDNINGNYRRFASSLGLGGVARFLKIDFPLLWPKIKWPCLLSLLFAFNNVEAGIFMGPNAPPSFPLLLLNSMQTASALQNNELHGFAIWLLLANGGLVAIFLLLASICANLKKWWMGLSLPIASLNRIYYMGFGLTFAGLAAHGGLLLLSVVGLAMEAWRRGAGFFSGEAHVLATGFFNSFLLGAISSIVAVFVFLWWRFNNAMAMVMSPVTAPRNFLARKIRPINANYILLLPLFLPDIILSLHGNMLSFLLGGGLVVKLGLLLLIHVGLGLGLAMLLLDAPYGKIPQNMLRHGRAIGLTSWRVFFRIVLPLLWRPLLFAIALSFAVSLSLYTPNLMLAAGHDTMTTLLVAYEFSGDNALLAMVSLWLLILPMAGYGIAYGLSTIYDRGK
ncbi:MAG: hypothetical protein QM529_06315 [Hydrotalea sp.]|nr:hypothetical protein [Hydrotalea sp.]